MPEPLDLEDDHEPPRKRGLSGCWIAAIVVVAIAGLGVLAAVGGVVYLVAVSPDTSIYEGDRVPSRFVETMKEVGALEDGEQLLYFYSDGLMDISEGFYFVSNRKVAVYFEESDEPLQTAAFDEIEAAKITRERSDLIDGEITVELKDGSSFWFPVSSEFDRDLDFHRAILERIE
jgi:hypothetical protein